MRKQGCPNARIDRTLNQSTAMNPVGAPGDTFLLRLEAKADTTITSTTLPKNWVLGSPKTLKAGANFIDLNTPGTAKRKKHEITITTSNGKTHTFQTELVIEVP